MTFPKVPRSGVCELLLFEDFYLPRILFYIWHLEDFVLFLMSENYVKFIVTLVGSLVFFYSKRCKIFVVFGALRVLLHELYPWLSSWNGCENKWKNFIEGQAPPPRSPIPKGWLGPAFSIFSRTPCGSRTTIVQQWGF